MYTKNKIHTLICKFILTQYKLKFYMQFYTSVFLLKLKFKVGKLKIYKFLLIFLLYNFLFCNFCFII